MTKSFSDLNKTMQENLKKEATFENGIKNLLELRNDLMAVFESFFCDLSSQDFYAFPFPKSKGNDCTTIAWSIYHVFRIEDIVCNSLIQNCEQVFFAKDFQHRLNSSIITTGNELSVQEIIDFSKQLNIQELLVYAKEVKETSEKMILNLSFKKTKSKISDEKKDLLKSLKVVSEEESSIWLIDYWCNKNIKGLLQMPFSRHWIMHADACSKIKAKLENKK